MYVGRRHTSTVTLKQVLPFHCVHCSHDARALVVGVGQGQGNSPYFLDEAGAKERASNSGKSAAHENAELTVKLALCPKCGARDEKKIRALKEGALIWVVACAALMPLIGVVLDALQHSGFGIWIFTPLGALCAWAVWRQQSWKWTTIDNRVAFLSEEDAGRL